MCCPSLSCLLYHIIHPLYGTQMMNDIGYPNKLLQVLGTWKKMSSMKTSIPARIASSFNKRTIELHGRAISYMIDKLQQLRGRMVCLPKAAQSRGQNRRVGIRRKV